MNIETKEKLTLFEKVMIHISMVCNIFNGWHVKQLTVEFQSIITKYSIHLRRVYVCIFFDDSSLNLINQHDDHVFFYF